MNPMLQPESLKELAEAIRSVPRVVPVGAGTKPRLTAADGVRISTAALSAMVEYEPQEFTFTAQAGIPLGLLMNTLAASGQYLPFDPPLVRTGATLGGTVAAGLSGPGRVRFGGVRDFILGVRFVDGAGRLLQLGGKVVKNAAGFDVPKFFCGSLGCFGMLAELTFKVFPRPAATVTLRLRAATPAERLRVFRVVGRSRWEPVAVEGVPGCCDVWVRLAGPESAMAALAADVLAELAGERESPGSNVMDSLREFDWAPQRGVLVKVPLTPVDTEALTPALNAIEGVRHQVGAGGAVAWVAWEDPGATPAVGSTLTHLGLEGLTLRGDAPLWWSRSPRAAVESAVKLALDPAHRFPPLDS